MFHFIVNSKNYKEASGKYALRLARVMSRAGISHKMQETKVRLYLAAPAFSISEISAKHPDLFLLTQHLDPIEAGSSTGYLVPEIAKMSGAKGSLVNHSEHRIPPSQIRKTIHSLRDLGMISVVCARDSREVEQFTKYNPDFIAIEPPDLIGSGRSVSKVKPALITYSRKSLEKSLNKGQSTVLLCGAGIVDELDVKRAVELGAEGILVASGVVKAENWLNKIRALSRGFSR